MGEIMFNNHNVYFYLWESFRYTIAMDKMYNINCTE